MKAMKKMMLTVLAVCMCYITSAQDDQKQIKKLKFGIKAGVNFANVTGNGLDFLIGDEESPNNRLGLMLGGLVTYQLSEKLYLQSELTYEQKGFSEDYSDEDFVETYALNYVSLPVLAKYYISDDFNFEVGPQIGFLLSAKYKDKEEGEKYEEDVKDLFKNTDFGLNFGAGYQLKNGLGLSARYYLGIADIFDYSRTTIRNEKFKKADEENEEEFVLKNRVFNLSFFYTF